MNIKKQLKIILPLVFGAFLVWYSLADISLKTLGTYFKEANYGYIMLGLLFGILSHLSRAYRWKFMLEPLGFKPKLTNSVLAVLIGYLVNLAIPRAGEISRATVMTNYENIPFEKAFGTIVAERIADLIMMLSIAAITLFVQFDFIYELLTKNFNPLKISIGLAVLSIGFYILTAVVKKATAGFLLKIKTFFTGLIEGVTSIFKMKKKWAFIGHTIFIWAMYLLMFYLCFFSLPETQNVPFGGILTAFVLGGFTVVLTNGGIGAYPLAIQAVLLLYDIDKNTGGAFGWIVWSAQTVMLLFFGLISFILIPLYNKRYGNIEA